MYICLCNGVTENQLKEAIANNARTMRELREQLNVATQCGKCSLQIKCLLKRYQDQRDNNINPSTRDKVTT